MTESVGLVAAEDRDATRLFVSLWAFSIVFDTAWTAHLATFSDRTPVVLAAIWAMFRPSSLPRFLLLVTLQTTAAVLDQPTPGNHEFFRIIVHVTMLLAIVLPPAARTLRELYARFAPPVRAEVIVVYAFAALSKLNGSFLDPDVSCAGLFYPQLAANIPIFPSGRWTIEAAIVTSVAVEAAIPILLWFRRTQSAGVLLGVMFHLTLAAAGAPAFSVIAFALLSLFLPPAVLRASGASFRSLLRHARAPALAGSPIVPILAVGVIMAPAISAQLGLLTVTAASWWASRTLWAIWLLVASLLAGVLVLGFASSARRLTSFAVPGTIPVLLWIGPVLTFANGLSPYMGAKTENSYTMFSNLHTEGEYWNHLLIPSTVRVFGLQDDLVRVIDSSDPTLKSLAGSGSLLVLTHFRDLTSRSPEAWVTYESGGRIQHVARIANVPFLSEPPGPPVLRRLLAFRPVDPRGACQH